jgi:hypothetical protein
MRFVPVSILLDSRLPAFVAPHTTELYLNARLQDVGRARGAVNGDLKPRKSGGEDDFCPVLS